MTVLDLQCLFLHTTVDPNFNPDSDYDLDVLHEVHLIDADREEVTLTLRLQGGHQVLAQFQATYLVTFEEEAAGEPRAWRALTLSWPYLRQEAATRLAAAGLQSTLPVELPIAAPHLTPLVREISAPAAIAPAPPTDDLARQLLVPAPLHASLAINAALQAILNGERQWALSVVRLYGALALASKLRPAGVLSELHSRNDDLLGDLLQRETGMTLATWRALPTPDRRSLLAQVRHLLVTLCHDVINQDGDMVTGQRQDEFHNEVEEIFDPVDENEEAQPLPMAEFNAPDEVYDYVTAPLDALGHDPSSDHGPLKRGITMTLTGDGRRDLIGITMAVSNFDFDDMFDDPSPDEEEPSTEERTPSVRMYRVRHLHIDHNAEPPLVFLTDLTLDEEIAAWDSEVAPIFSADELKRLDQAQLIAQSPWPPDGRILALHQLDWADAITDVSAFEEFLVATPELNPAQLEEALRVPEVNPVAVVNHSAVTPGLLGLLATHPVSTVRETVAAHPLLPAHSFEVLWNDLDRVRIGLAQNPSAPPDLLKRLAHVDSLFVRSQLALHPHLDGLLLRVLAEDFYGMVRCNVAGNPSAPESLLNSLLEDIDPEVRDAASQALFRRSGSAPAP